ncbi:MAG: hypothetical protein DSY33_04880 [Archaeoglobus sp.]|nr:MAG: hypothetical protein DSY33_04880 [Archaeoglobus sp.]
MEEPKGVGSVPKPVQFTYPEGVKKEGTVIKEVGAEIEVEKLGKYYAVIQLIEWQDGEKDIRFGYYRKKPGAKRYNWAKQPLFSQLISLRT